MPIFWQRFSLHRFYDIVGNEEVTVVSFNKKSLKMKLKLNFVIINLVTVQTGTVCSKP